MVTHSLYFFFDDVQAVKFFWQHTVEGKKLEFNNTPFIVSQIKKMHCQFGTHYYKQKESEKSKRTNLQGTRKVGCTANVSVYTITLYPNYSIDEEETSGCSCRGLKQKKKDKLTQLRDAASQGKKLNSIVKYYVCLPEEEAHHGYHQTHGAASYAQRIHPKLIEKIYELVSEGITEIQEVKRSLKNYVQHSLCADIKPDLTDRSYYPTTTDIHNHIYLAQRSCQLSKLDQENLSLKVEKWKRANPASNFYFRPYKESKAYESKGLDKLDSKMDTVNSEANTFDQTLLYVHQEPWQQDLMVKYGNTISLMDATYKTTRYELALFFVAVKTNVGYTAVADFVLQSETAEQIAEALKILSSWNPKWQPPYFMTDYSEAEI